MKYKNFQLYKHFLIVAAHTLKVTQQHIAVVKTK